MGITLFGHGYVGTAIAAELDRQQLGFTWLHAKEVPAKGDTVINAAGYTGSPNVDACESHQEECIAGNVTWPVWLAKQGNIVVHIGSGCVYSGGPYDEKAEPNFTGSFYSLSKVLGQAALAPYMNYGYLLRVRMPFSGQHSQKNLFDKLASYKKLINHTNSMTRLEDIARTAIWFATTLPAPGVYNVVNPGAVTTAAIAAELGLNPEWFTDEEFSASIRAPRSQCVLDSGKLQALFPLAGIDTAIIEAAKEWRKL